MEATNVYVLMTLSIDSRGEVVRTNVGVTFSLHEAEDTLRRFHPALFTEVHETFEPLQRLLSQQGYMTKRMTFDQPPRKHGWTLDRWLDSP